MLRTGCAARSTNRHADPLRRFIVLSALLACAATPAGATAEYDYGPDEYVIIDGGLSPDARTSLAAHAAGTRGDFHVRLMAEPAHRRIAMLDDISDDNNLDTKASAYHAEWSKDLAMSRFRGAASGMRCSSTSTAWKAAARHLIAGPSLFKDVTGRDIGNGDDIRRGIPSIEWRTAKRFVLRQRMLLMTSDAAFARRLGRFGRIAERHDGGRFLVEFSAEADCVLAVGHRIQHC